MIRSVILLGWLLGGQALLAAAQEALPTDGNAMLWIYQKGSFGSGATYDVWINGQLVAPKFRKSSYFQIEVPAGTLLLRTTGKPAYFVEEKKFWLKASSGQQYFIEAVQDYDFMAASLYLVERDALDFQKKIEKLVPFKKAKSRLE